MTDKEHADAVRATQHTLNDAIHQAKRAGLEVVIRLDSVQDLPPQPFIKLAIKLIA